MFMRLFRQVGDFRKLRKRRPIHRSRPAPVALERLETRITPTTAITTLNFNIPADVAQQGLQVGLYGAISQNKGAAEIFLTSSNGALSYTDVSTLQPGSQMPLITLLPSRPSATAQTVSLQVPLPGNNEYLYSGELFMFVGTVHTGLIVNNQYLIAAPTATPDPAATVTPDNFAQFEFTYNNQNALDIDTSTIDSTGVPFTVTYPSSSASFPLNPLGVTLTQTSVVQGYTNAFQPSGPYANYPQFAQDAQFDPSQVVAPQDILAVESNPPILNAALATTDPDATALAGMEANGSTTLTLSQPLTAPLLAGWSVVGTNIPGTATVAVNAPIGATTVTITQAASGTGNYVFTFTQPSSPLANLPGTAIAGAHSVMLASGLNVTLLAGMNITGTSIPQGTYVTANAAPGSTSVSISQAVTGSGDDTYSFSANLAPNATYYYLVTAFSKNPIPNANGIVGETLPSNSVGATAVPAGLPVQLEWNEYNDPNTAGYNVYRYSTTNGVAPTSSSAYSLIAHLPGKNTTRYTDIGAVPQAIQVTPGTATNYGFNPLSDYYTQDLYNFFVHYETPSSFVLNRDGSLWAGNTILDYTPNAAWNTTSFNASFTSGANTITVVSPPTITFTPVGSTTGVESFATSLYVGETISGPGIHPGTTIQGITGSTVTLSQATTASGMGTSLVAQATYSVLQLTAQSAGTNIQAGDVVSIYYPVFATNTINAPTINNLPPPPMPIWMQATNGEPGGSSIYESPGQMVFGCDAVFASNAYDPDSNDNAVGDIENSIVSAFNRGIALNYNIPPDNWAAFPSMVNPPIVAVPAGSTGTLAPNTYYYVVTAVNPYGESTPSLEVSATVGTPGQAVTLSWANGPAAPPASSFNVYRGTSSTNLTLIASGNVGTSYTDLGGQPSSTTTPPNQYFTPGTNSNYYAAYVQSNSSLNPTTGVSINGLSYGFPYSDQGGTSTNIYFVTPPPLVTISMQPLGGPGFFTQSLPDAIANTPYSQNILASGPGADTTTFAVASGSSLPPGWNLSPSGVLSGPGLSATPPGVPYSFVVTATNSLGTSSRTYTLSVDPTAPVPPFEPVGGSPIVLPGIDEGVTIPQNYGQFQVTGGVGPYLIVYTDGLPAGISNLQGQTSSNGTFQLTGTPTAPSSAGYRIQVQDSLNLMVQGSDAVGSDTLTLTSTAGLVPGMTVSGPGIPLAGLPGSGVFTTYITTILSSTQVVLSQAASSSNSPVTFTFDDALGSNQASSSYNSPLTLQITVNSSPLTIIPATLPTAITSQFYSQQLSTNATNEAVTYTVAPQNPLPAWLTLSPAGLLTGTPPSSGGPYTFAISAADAGGGSTTSPQMFTLNVQPPGTFQISPATLPPAKIPYQQYTANLSASGGVAPYSFGNKVVSGSLPPDFAFTPGTNSAAITGPATAPSGGGTYLFTVRVIDALGDVTFQSYQISLPQVIPSTSNLPSNATALVINGSGFDPNPVNDTVTIADPTTPAATVTAKVTSASPTQLILSIVQTGVQASDVLNAVVTNQEGWASASTQVATVANASTPTIAARSQNLAANGTTLIINGSGFDPNTAANVVALSSGTAVITQATATSLTVTLTGSLAPGALLATVTSDGVPSSSAQVATVVPATLVTVNNNISGDLIPTDTTLTITGTNFDTSANAEYLVQLYQSDQQTLLQTITAITPNSTNQLTLGGLHLGSYNGVIYARLTMDGITTALIPVGTAVGAQIQFLSNNTNTFVASNATALTLYGYGFTPPSLFGTSTNGSTSLTVTNSTDLSPGMEVVGPGIASGTTITAISSNTLTLSSAAGSGAGSGAFLFYANAYFTGNGVNALSLNTTSTTGSNSLPVPNTNGMFVGMGVTGPGIPNGTTITAINYSSATGTLPSVTLSASAVPGAGAGTFTFYLLAFQGTATNGSNMLTVTPNTNGLKVGMTVAGPGIPAGTTISSISTSNPTVVTLSASANSSAMSGTTYYFSLPAPTGTSTAGSDSVTVSSTNGLSVGMALVNGPGFLTTYQGSQSISAAVTIVAITGNTVTLSTAASSSQNDPPAGTGTFIFANAPSDAVPVTGTSTSGSTSLTVSSTGGLFNGMVVTGPGIPAGTRILTITSGTTLTLSVPANASADSGSFTFVGYPVSISGASFATMSVDSPNQITFGGLSVSAPVNTPLIAQVGAGIAPAVAQVFFSSITPAITSSTTSVYYPSSLPLTIGGTFDPTGTNVVTLYLNSTANPLPPGAIALVTGGSEQEVTAAANQLTLTLAGPLPVGNLLALVTTDGISTGNPVQVATVVPPSVTPGTTKVTDSPTILTIDGSGFDTSSGGSNTVNLYSSNTPIPADAIASVIARSSTQLAVILNGGLPLPAGPLSAAVSVDGLPLGTVSLATLVAGGPTITFNPADLPLNASTLIINGSGFDPNPANDIVTLSTAAGPIPGAVNQVSVNATGTQVTVALNPNSLPQGQLYATITTTNGPTAAISSEVQVANVAGTLLHLTSGNSATFIVGQTPAGSYTITASGNPTFTVLSGLPDGVTLTDNNNGTATLSGSPGFTTGVFTFNIIVSNSQGSSIEPFTLTIINPPSFLGANSTTFTVGKNTPFIVTTSPPAGTTLATSLSESGPLPAGVRFVPGPNGTGRLTGAPAAGSGGVFPIRIIASNVTGSQVQDFTLTVNQPTPAFTSAANAVFTLGQAGIFIINTTSYPALATIIQTGLPSGFSFNASPATGTATIQTDGQSIKKGTYHVTLTAAIPGGGSATQMLTLLVKQPVLAFTSAASTTFALSQMNHFTITTTGFPTATLSEVGGMPTNVSFTPNPNGTATISGMPVTGAGQKYTFILLATSGQTTIKQTFALTVAGPPFYLTAPGPLGTEFAVGKANTVTITTLPGLPAATTFALTRGQLPRGLKLSSNGHGGAVISGTPAAGTGGSYTFTLTASNSPVTQVSRSFTLVVNQAQPAIIGPATMTFTEGQSNSFTITTTGYPWSLVAIARGNLPPGLSLTNIGNGKATVSGAPLAGTAGVYTLVLSAANGMGAAIQTLTLIVNSPPLITSAASTTFTQGRLNSFVITAEGLPVSKLTVQGRLPVGVAFFDMGNGVGLLFGAPITRGTFTFLIQASNGGLLGSLQEFSLTVV